MNRPESVVKGHLTDQNTQYYQDFGYLVVPELLDQKELESLKREALEIVKGKKGNVEGLLPNADQLSDEEALKQYSAIHFPHKISPVMKQYAAHDQIAAVLAGIVSPNMKCLQTMLFMKGPGKAGQSWHQDEYFIPTRDKSLVGVWIALEDADLQNGCLWVIPGSHKDGFIRRRIDNKNSEFADLEVADLTPYTEKDAVRVEVKSGSVIIFNGYLLHMSLSNKTSDRYRRALVSHYCSAESMLPWDQDGRLDFTQDFRDVFMVAGTDPYDYKGTEDLSRPFVRPEVLAFNREELKRKKS